MVKRLRGVLGFAIGLMVLPGVAYAQSTAAPYTVGKRYDIASRLTGTISPDPDGSGSLKYAAVRNTYNTLGLLTKVETGELSSWQTEAVAPANWSGFAIHQTVETQYDDWGQKTKVTVKSGGTTYSVTQYKYDNFGRLVCTAVRMDPSLFGSLPSDACALSQAETSQNGHLLDRITKYHYDSAHDYEIQRIEKAVGTSLQQDYATYTRYQNGPIKFTTDANGNKAQYNYDGFDRLTYWYFPSKTTTGSVNYSDYERYEYDANGNRTVVVKRSGESDKITYTYDALNQVTEKDLSSGQDVFYRYDMQGLELRARFSSINGTGLTKTYDGFGRLKTATTDMGGTSRTLTYGYDKNSNRTSVKHPDNETFTYDYDGLDRVETIKHGSTTLVTLAYDSQGRRQNLARAGAGSTAYGYDAVSRLSSLSHDLSGTSSDVTYGFTAYNPASQIVTRTINNGLYTATDFSRVTGSYVPNGLNQYTSAGGVDYDYDGRGNLTEIDDGSTTTTYTYDLENRLTAASGGTVASLTYDPAGRLFQTVGGVTTQFLYDGDSLIGEYNSSGTLQRRYVHGPGIDEPLVWYEGSGVSSSAKRFLHADHQGSIIARTDNGGVQTETFAYDAYGIPSGATQLDRFAYTGQVFLPELGLYYYKARLYSPTIGRFLQTDPVGYDDQMNLYAYVGNDPVNFTDPSGLFLAPGDRFDTEEEAVDDFFDYAEDEAKKDRKEKERGADFKQDKGGKYYYDDVQVGDPGEVDIEISNRTVAIAHTHPKDKSASINRRNENLSPGDRRMAKKANEHTGRRVRLYLKTPSGARRRWDGSNNYRGPGVQYWNPKKALDIGFSMMPRFF